MVNTNENFLSKVQGKKEENKTTAHSGAQRMAADSTVARENSTAFLPYEEANSNDHQMIFSNHLGRHHPEVHLPEATGSQLCSGGCLNENT